MSKQSPKDPKFRCNICKEYFYAPDNIVHYQCPEHGYLCEKHVGQKDMLVFGHDDVNNPNKLLSPNLNPKDDPYFDIIINLPELLTDKCLCDAEESIFNQINFFRYVGPDNFNEKFINELKDYDLDQFKDEIGDNVVDEFISIGIDSWGEAMRYNFNDIRIKKTKLNEETLKTALTKLKELAIKQFELETDTPKNLLERQFLQKKCKKNLSKYIWNNNIKRWLEVGKEKEDDFINETKNIGLSKNENLEIKFLIELFEKNILSKEQFLEQLRSKI
jgi:hypothetical protein